MIQVNERGHLELGGCDSTELAEKYGTPLYVMDEQCIRESCRRFKKSLEKYFGQAAKAVYASKALNCKAILQLVFEEGLDVEVVSGGELYTALAAGIRPENIHFQGNNKTPGELKMAVENRVGDIVVDNFDELRQLDEISRENHVVSKISIRIKPGIDAHTHEFIRTGQIDSKFGTAIETGEAFEIVKEAIGMKYLRLTGLHCHIGSQIFQSEPFVHAARVMLNLYIKIRQELAYELPMLNLGGGFGIKYTDKDEALETEEYIKAIWQELQDFCNENQMDIPQLLLEPGRSIVGEAGTTLYTVGNIKEIPDIRNYVAVDGGMFENPRFAIYNAEYSCLLANRANESADYLATIAGKCCESGDLIQQDVMIQRPEPGDILAVLATGAYNYSMASNYNRNPRPAIVMVLDGTSRVIVRGETYEDLIQYDL